MTPEPSPGASCQRLSTATGKWRIRPWLRPLPRRSNIRRMRMLGRFAQLASSRRHLWAWRKPQVIRGVYVGWLLTMQPAAGFQIVLAVLASILFKANITVSAGLQLVTNPLTAVPVYGANFALGRWLLGHTRLAEEASQLGAAAMYLVFGGLVVGLAAALLSHAMIVLWPSRAQGRPRSPAYLDGTAVPAIPVLKD